LRRGRRDRSRPSRRRRVVAMCLWSQSRSRLWGESWRRTGAAIRPTRPLIAVTFSAVGHGLPGGRIVSGAMRSWRALALRLFRLRRARYLFAHELRDGESERPSVCPVVGRGPCWQGRREPRRAAPVQVRHRRAGADPRQQGDDPRSEYEDAARFMASIGVRCSRSEQLALGGVIGSVSKRVIVGSKKYPTLACESDG
jgi:hypothetical protein